MKQERSKIRMRKRRKIEGEIILKTRITRTMVNHKKEIEKAAAVKDVPSAVDKVRAMVNENVGKLMLSFRDKIFGVLNRVNPVQIYRNWRARSRQVVESVLKETDKKSATENVGEETKKVEERREPSAEGKDKETKRINADLVLKGQLELDQAAGEGFLKELNAFRRFELARSKNMEESEVSNSYERGFKLQLDKNLSASASARARLAASMNIEQLRSMDSNHLLVDPKTGSAQGVEAGIFGNGKGGPKHAENITVGDDLMSLIRSTKGHRENILGAYSHVGFGVAQHKSGKWVLVQHFVKRRAFARGISVAADAGAADTFEAKYESLHKRTWRKSLDDLKKKRSRSEESKDWKALEMFGAEALCRFLTFQDSMRNQGVRLISAGLTKVSGQDKKVPRYTVKVQDKVVVDSSGKPKVFAYFPDFGVFRGAKDSKQLTYKGFANYVNTAQLAEEGSTLSLESDAEETVDKEKIVKYPGKYDEDVKAAA
jgi:hypothetical protein